MTTSAPGGHPIGHPERRTWDLVLTITLLVVLVAAAAVLELAGAFLVMASDSCGGSGACRTDQLSAGVFVAVFGPAVVAIIAVAAAVLRLVRARLAFWVPLVGLAIAGLVWAGGVALVFGAVPTS
jgi:archaellum biogenesis protein FlaJ (TadC family)